MILIGFGECDRQISFLLYTKNRLRSQRRKVVSVPARDIYHDNFKNALIKDGWIITHDPYMLKWGLKDLYIDLGAQKLLAAEKQEQKIAVEIKSFVSPSEVEDLKNA